MKKSISIAALAIILLFVVSAIAADKVVVIPLNATADSSEGFIMRSGEPYMLANTNTYSIGLGGGTEARDTMVLPRGGTISDLYLRPNLDCNSGAIVTATIRVNGVDQSLSVTHTSSTDHANTVSNTTDTVTVVAGDKLTIHFQETGGVASGCNFNATWLFK